MRYFLIALLLSFTSLFAQERIGDLAHAIARSEGFYLKGSLSQRCHNPGDLKSFRDWKQVGQVGVCRGGHVRFRNDEAGWRALYHQLQRIVDGTSGHYNVNMTVRDMGHRYAGNWRMWSRNVAHRMGVSPNAPLWEVLDVGPAVTFNASLPDLWENA